MRRNLQSNFKSKFRFKNNPQFNQTSATFFNSFYKKIIQLFIYSFCLSLLLIGLYSCFDEKIIEQDKLVLIYTDLLIAQDTVTLDDKGVDSLRQSVFKKYNVTEKEYENTIEYYNDDLKRWEEFFDKVTAHIGSLNTKAD